MCFKPAISRLLPPTPARTRCTWESTQILYKSVRTVHLSHGRLSAHMTSCQRILTSERTSSYPTYHQQREQEVPSQATASYSSSSICSATKSQPPTYLKTSTNSLIIFPTKTRFPKSFSRFRKTASTYLPVPLLEEYGREIWHALTPGLLGWR